MTVSVDRTSQRYSSGPQDRPRMILLHTTEGWGWPPYNGGSDAPHATITPIPGKGIAVREHRRWTDFGKALVNASGGVETNTDGVIQFELVGTCYSGGPGYKWYQADAVVLASMADYLRPIAAAYGIPNHTLPFLPYPASYGRTSTRMANAEWTAFRGWCGHQHAPENDHGDPGAFPIAALLNFIYHVQEEDDMPYTPEQLENAAASGVLGAQIGNKVTETGKPYTVGIALDRTVSGVAALPARLDALEKKMADLVATISAFVARP